MYHEFWISILTGVPVEAGKLFFVKADDRDLDVSCISNSGNDYRGPMCPKKSRS